MRYEEGKALIRASGSFEDVAPTAIADALVGALFRPMYEQRETDTDDVRTAAAAAYELGRLGLERGTFLSLNRTEG